MVEASQQSPCSTAPHCSGCATYTIAISFLNVLFNTPLNLVAGIVKISCFSDVRVLHMHTNTQGRAYSLFTPASARMAGALAALLRDAGQTVPSELNQMAAVAAGGTAGLAGGGGTPAGGSSGAATKPR
jgi:hypothetical protein